MRKKGCLIATIVVFILLIVSLIFVGQPFFNRALIARSGQIVAAVETAIEDYTREIGASPQGTNRAMVSALSGANPEKKDYLGEPFANVIIDGELVDVWRKPLRLAPTGDGKFGITSAGPNGKFDDGDDIGRARLTIVLEAPPEKTEEKEKPSKDNLPRPQPSE